MFTSHEYQQPAAFQIARPAALAADKMFFPSFEPAWKAEAFKCLDKIKALPGNWDGYGSAAIPQDLIRMMASLISALPGEQLPRGLPAPEIAPASDGIQIEWNGGRGGVEIIMHPDRTAAWVVESGGQFEDGQLNPEDSVAVVRLLQRVFDLPDANNR